MSNNEYAFLHLDFDFDFLGWTEDRLKQWGLSKEFVLNSVLEGLITVSNSRPNESDTKYNDFRQDVVNRLQTDFGIKTTVGNVSFIFKQGCISALHRSYYEILISS